MPTETSRCFLIIGPAREESACSMGPLQDPFVNCDCPYGIPTHSIHVWYNIYRHLP